MNEQNNTSYFVEKTDRDTNTPVVSSDTYTGEVLVDKIPVQELLLVETVAVVDPQDEPIVHEASIVTTAGSLAALLSREESEHYRTRWNEIQGKFVDEPRSAVQQADALVSEVIEKITQMFGNEHSSLEGQWNQVIIFTGDFRLLSGR